MGEDGGAQVCERLILAHQVEIVFGLDVEQVQNLIQHLTVLRGDTDARIDIFRLRQLADDRSHFHGFGTGSKNREDFQFTISD